MILKSTKNLTGNINVLVYGPAGCGKTKMISTLPTPVILSAEDGLRTLKKFNLPYADIRKFDDFKNAIDWFELSTEANQFESLAIDSLSEICEILLAERKAKTSDGRKAYLELSEMMDPLLRRLKFIEKKNIYVTAKVEKKSDEMGRILYWPMAPGQQFAQSIPHNFDHVFAARSEKNTDGQIVNFLMCRSDGLWSAKTRGDELGVFEEQDMQTIINKLNES